MNYNRYGSVASGLTGIQEAKMLKDEMKHMKKVNMLSDAILLSEAKKKMMK